MKLEYHIIWSNCSPAIYKQTSHIWYISPPTVCLAWRGARTKKGNCSVFSCRQDEEKRNISLSTLRSLVSLATFLLLIRSAILGARHNRAVPWVQRDAHAHLWWYSHRDQVPFLDRRSAGLLRSSRLPTHMRPWK